MKTKHQRASYWKTKIYSIGNSVENAKNLYLSIRYQFPEIKREVFEYIQKIKSTKLLSWLLPGTYESINFRVNEPLSLKQEIDWALLVFAQLADKIRLFNDMKNQFEQHFFNGKYDSCITVIDHINSLCGHSFWSLKNSTLVAHTKDGLEASRKNIQSKKITPVCNVFIEIYGTCIEDEMSFFGADEHLKGYANGWKKDFPEYSYLLKYLINNTYEKVEEIPVILSFLNEVTLIDYYESFIAACIKLSVNDMLKDLPKSYLEKIYTLSKIINDPRLDQIANSLYPMHLPVAQIKNDFIKIIESYTKEEYYNAKITSFSLLQKEPNIFDNYEIYVKALISNGDICNEHLIVNAQSNSPANYLLKRMYDVIIKNSSIQTSLVDLLKITRTYSSLRISFAITHFCAQYGFVKSADHKLSCKMALFCNYCCTPRFALIYEDNNQKELYLDCIEKTFGQLKCISPYRFTFDPTVSSNTCREKVYYTDALIEHRRFDEAVVILEDEYRKNDSLLHRERIIVSLISCYIEKQELEKLQTIVADTIIENEYYLFTVTSQKLFSEFESIKRIGSINSLFYSIFITYYLKKNPTKDTKIKYNVFCNVLEEYAIEKPSEFIEHIKMGKYVNSQYVIFFLSNMATQEILEDDWHYDSAEDAYNERIKLCEFLTTADSLKAEKYRKEKLDILSKIEINRFVRKADSSKIHVETEKIINNLDDKLKEMCNRYLAYAKLPKELRSSMEATITEEKVSGCSNDVLIDSAFELFKIIFDKLKLLFVEHDEYGLDSFLSGRIRHGVLDSNIRSVFEKHFLVTKKSEGQYLPNLHWDIKTNASLNDEFAKLSMSVDALLEEVISIWIQCSCDPSFLQILNDTINPGFVEEVLRLFDQNSEKGFQYHFKNDEIKTFYENISDIHNITELCEQIFSILWKHTDNCLEKIRTRVENRLKENLISALGNFQSIIEEQNIENKDRLISSINSCRGDLDLKIKEIANWFKLSKSITYDDYQLKKLFMSCVTIYNGFKASAFDPNNIQCYESRTFKDSSFLPLFDIIYTLLGNILKHAEDKTSTMKIEVTSDEETLKIDIVNEISEDTDLNDIKMKIEESNTSYDKSLLRKESGTGFHKIRNTLKNNFPGSHLMNKIMDPNFFSSSIILNLKDVLK